MVSSSLLTLLWSYLWVFEKIIVLLAVLFMVHGMCVSLYWFLEPHTQRVCKLYTDVKWSLEQLWKPLVWMRRICGARMTDPPQAAPAARAPLAMPAWPPQVAPRAQGGARTRSPYRSR